MQALKRIDVTKLPAPNNRMTYTQMVTQIVERFEDQPFTSAHVMAVVDTHKEYESLKRHNNPYELARQVLATLTKRGVLTSEKIPHSLYLEYRKVIP